jgi:ABC-type molybdate transport system substrate-binding protein
MSRGASHPFAMLAGISMIIVGLLIGALCWESEKPASATAPGKDQSGPAEPKRLFIYCAPALKPAVDPIAKEYESKYGVTIQIQSAASEMMLTQLKAADVGDLFLPADESYLTLARKDSLIEETIPLVRMHPVIAVKKGNPKNIHSTKDFLRPDVKVTLSNPAAAIGKVARGILEKSGEWSEIEKQRAEFKNKISDVMTVTEAANAVKLEAADTSVVWDSTAAQYPELDAVEQPDFEAAVTPVSIAVLHCTKQPAQALHFARYLSARDKGLLEFKKKGYTIADGDEWAEHPQLKFYAGAMLRPAIEETLKEFEQREGLPHVITVYNGCGILVGMMRVDGERPDAYFSCDNSFMSQVKNLYEKPVEMSANEMVILTAKGNPKGIHSLQDLTTPGLKLGMGDEKQCALGFLTKDALDTQKICEAVQKNIAVRSPTGDFLVNQMRTGSLDAVIVYESNATFVKDVLDVVPIKMEQKFATQPVAVGKTTKYKNLTQRLVDALRSPKSAERFKTNGFQWLADQK